MKIDLSNISIDELNYRASSSVDELHKTLTNSNNNNQKKRVSGIIFNLNAKIFSIVNISVYKDKKKPINTHYSVLTYLKSIGLLKNIQSFTQ